MWIDPIKLQNQNKLIHDYQTNQKDILDFFDYAPHNAESFSQRLAELKTRSFKREGLVQVLMEMNKEWDASEATLANIKRLKDENSVVVIGGQQAGLLTGPLYTIHKVISIIHLARVQEKKLHVPVIPVFWIAGEDHDFAEINHVMMPLQGRMKKYRTLQRADQKRAVSQLHLDKEKTKQWVQMVFGTLTETEHTAELYSLCNQIIDQSETFVDFFAKLIFYLFEQEGLVLMDSNDSRVRKLESDYFLQMIKEQPNISGGVYQTLRQLQQRGYSVSVDAEENDGHLFIQLNGERILLIRNGSDWVGKQGECRYSQEEMLEIARNTPELLSNNVVTRPLMQELLFPSLAFLGGPGEVAYWSVLQNAFYTMDMKMPPVLTRLSFTLVDHKIRKLLDKHLVSAGDAVNNGVLHEKTNWLASQASPPIEQVVDQVKLAFERNHAPLRQIAKDMRADLGELAEKNLFHLFRELEFMEDRLTQAFEEKHQHVLEEFDSVNVALHPEDGLQERMWNVIPYLNLFGKSFIQEILQQDFDYKQDHYLIYL
ncbi:bacillithiol biosynthesis cysteine-adding enzyme BshC [Radiobacillus kanasensis]|uniref:bacillithiol biosynthesis cysteine-adding enzyme BshC n=1 Tax=Radiobacillus kanasensis TaxID=2844358 RepID=UPI001E3B7D40|nr:bacillithiol biosynthesis cysteine-adding enzyme BshC [Radiobacillus kanasensis]UFU00932.1 bacillithiol biosynthesis cysteine-adding enzyme BshC [Radiobacillus kanasensis]